MPLLPLPLPRLPPLPPLPPLPRLAALSYNLPTPMLDLIAFDADDTLWHTEHLYSDAEERFKQLLAPYTPGAEIEQKLIEIEGGNLRYFGFGIKSFALSMIETAIALTDGRINGHDIQRVIDLAKSMLSAEV